MAQRMIKSATQGNPEPGGGNVREMTGAEKGDVKLEREATEEEGGEASKTFRTRRRAGLKIEKVKRANRTETRY